VLQAFHFTHQSYSAAEMLRDGRSIEIRALRPDDETPMLTAISRTSPQSLYRRFFGVKKGFSGGERAFFLNVDFVNHVALVATIAQSDHTEIVGGARYVVVQPRTAEVACTVIDAFQGKGVGSALMRHLILLARRASLKQLVADVLPENAAMINILMKSGMPATTTRAKGVVHVRLDILQQAQSSEPSVR
jgi:RimJ/RimL family protein N-acetyltransferase